MDNYMTFLWLIAMVGFLIAEAACPLHLVTCWFAVGSLVAMIATLLGAPLWLQILLFIVISLGLLIALWPLTKKLLTPTVTPTNVDSVIGTEGYIQDPVDNLNATGSVKLGGMIWTARSTSGENIPAGTLVKVDKIEGVKAFVSKV